MMLAIQDRLKGRSETSAFETLCLEVGRKAGSAKTIAGQIDILVGFDGRVPIRFGLDSLTIWQRAFYERLGARVAASPVQSLADVPVRSMVIGMRPYGRIIIQPSGTLEPDDLAFFQLQLDDDEARIVAARALELSASERPIDEELDRYFATATEQELQQMREDVATGLDRVDPVLVFVREETLTNVPAHNGLLKGRGGKDGDYLLSRLQGVTGVQWPWEAKSFIFCMHLLRGSGFRGEEFNGRQFTPHHLGRFFDDAIELFVSALPDAVPPGKDASLQTKARFLAAARSRIAKTHNFYRWVNGITLLKTQDFYPSDSVQPLSIDELPDRVAAYLGRYVPSWSGQSLADLFTRFVRGGIDQGEEVTAHRVHRIEGLLLEMVLATTEALHADVGMTRCLRQLGNLVRVHDQDLAEEACNWPQAEYFCAVVPGLKMSQLMTGREDQLADILKAISARMRYNGWHYMPGHFPLERKPADRHFYTPPAMADTAEWSDQHHRGHVAAGVRYSIRSPGALRYGGKTYPGFYDLRFMRCEGPPFSFSELLIAIRHTRTIGLLYQALLSVVAETRSAFRITAFSNQWFDGVCWPAIFAGGVPSKNDLLP